MCKHGEIGAEAFFQQASVNIAEFATSGCRVRRSGLNSSGSSRPHHSCGDSGTSSARTGSARDAAQAGALYRADVSGPADWNESTHSDGVSGRGNRRVHYSGPNRREHGRRRSEARLSPRACIHRSSRDLFAADPTSSRSASEFQRAKLTDGLKRVVLGTPSHPAHPPLEKNSPCLRASVCFIVSA